MYVADFFRNGALEQIVTFYKSGVSYPLAGRDEIVRLFPQLRGKYPSYASFGASRIEDVLPGSELAHATVLEAFTFASAIARNGGASGFAFDTLPVAAQIAPMRASLASDFDGDGHADLLLGGNFYGVPPLFGRYDASYSVLLRGGSGAYSAVDLEAGAPAIDGQIRKLGLARGAGGRTLILVARNDDRLLVLRPRSASPHPTLARAPR